MWRDAVAIAIAATTTYSDTMLPPQKPDFPSIGIQGLQGNHGTLRPPPRLNGLVKVYKREKNQPPPH